MKTDKEEKQHIEEQDKPHWLEEQQITVDKWIKKAKNKNKE